MLLRDAARLLSERMNVAVVDTNNEIAGCCDAPHSSVGMATRIMVHNREEQANEMARCVRSHSPNTMVVDELDSEVDINAADYCSRRSIRLLAAAVGSLEELLANESRSRLVGGVRDNGSEGRRRAAEPMFDVIVQLRRGAYHEWTIVDTAKAVDATLSGQSYLAQVRTIDPDTGSMLLSSEELY